MTLPWWPAKVEKEDPLARQRRETDDLGLREQYDKFKDQTGIDLDKKVVEKELEDLQERVEEFKEHQPGSTDLDDQLAADELAGETVDAHMIEEIEVEVLKRARMVHQVPLEVVTEPPEVVDDWH